MTPAPARLDGEIVFARLPAPAIERLRLKLSLPNPKYVALKRFAGFTGSEPDRIECCVEMPDGSVHVPRGAIDVLKEQLARYDLCPQLGDDQRSRGARIAPPFPGGINLRDYQHEAIAKLRAKTQGLVVLPCGGGKTRLGVGAILAFLTSTLVLVHTADLADQWLEELGKCGVAAGLVGGGRSELDADVVVGIIDSVLPRLDADTGWGHRFGFVVVDECFPAGTQVEGRPIETIAVGDEVASFDPTTGERCRQRVIRTFRRPVRDLVRVTFRTGETLVVSPNHQLWTQEGWTRADACEGRSVLHEAPAPLPRMRFDQQVADGAVLHGVQNDQTNRATQSRRAIVRSLRSRGAPIGETGTRPSTREQVGVLLEGPRSCLASNRQLSNDGVDQSALRVRTNDGTQPHAARRDPNKGVDNAFSHGPQAANSGRQWPRSDGATGPIGPSTELALRSRRSDRHADTIASTLQDRYRRTVLENRDRSRRPISSSPSRESGRHAQRRVTSWARVDRVEVLQPGRDGKFGGLCPDGLVYNLEVEETHAYFANGLAVSNCHHAPAQTVQRILCLLPAYYRLGLTATPERQDGLSNLVEWSFGETLLERSTREMIKLGFLMPAEIVVVSTGWQWDYDGPEKKRLAVLEQDLAAATERNALIADTIARDAREGATCLVLVRTREHASVLAEMIVARGVEARALTGKTAKKKRKATIDDLRGGSLAVAVATSLADEGLDLPRLSVIALASPARAKGATIQRLGRLLRVWPGKKPRLYDFVDDDVDTLASRAAARRRVYIDAGLLQPAA